MTKEISDLRLKIRREIEELERGAEDFESGRFSIHDGRTSQMSDAARLAAIQTYRRSASSLKRFVEFLDRQLGQG